MSFKIKIDLDFDYIKLIQLSTLKLSNIKHINKQFHIFTKKNHVYKKTHP